MEGNNRRILLTLCAARGGLPVVLGCGALVSVTMAVFDFAGGTLRGPAEDPTVDEFDRKEALRKNRRRPMSETIAQIGEGRGEICQQSLATSN
jgi:hypothetical protein